MLERKIQNDILRTFGTDPRLRLWRSNTGAAKIKGRVVRFGVPGSPDLVGILPGGIWLGIEVKSETGRQSTEQINFMNMVRRFGGVYVLARSVQDVWDAIGGYLK